VLTSPVRACRWLCRSRGHAAGRPGNKPAVTHQLGMGKADSNGAVVLAVSSAKGRELQGRDPQLEQAVC